MIFRTFLPQLLLLCIFAVCSGQESNIFLERSFWKTNPSVAIVKEKISDGHNPSELNRYAFDAVSYALIENVDNPTVLFLLEQDGNGVNKLTHDGRTYIFWAAYKDNLDIMMYLVENGAKTDIIDSHGYSLLNFAAVTGQLNQNLYELCFDYGSNIIKEKNNDGANALLLVAPFLKDDTLIDYFISKGLNLMSTDNNGNGIFNYAARRGSTNLMELLINKNVPYKGLNQEGGNAILFAAEGTRGHVNTLATFQFLENLGLEVNVTTKEGDNPLHKLANKSQDSELLKYFINHGVKIDQKNKDGDTPFINAAYGSSLACLILLQEHVADINHKNNDGLSALTVAIRRNKPDAVQFLIENGADIFLKDGKENSLAVHLVESFNPKKNQEFQQNLNFLTEAGLNMTGNQGNGNTVYHHAVLKNSIQLLELLESYNISINSKNKEGNTALHLAAMKAKDTNVMKYLVEKGADKYLTTSFEETAFRLAQENEALSEKNVMIDFLR
jgi:ankyrin repeat protein